MRKLYFLPAALLLGLAACNNSSDQAATSDTTKKAGTDTSMAMNHTADTSKAIAPVPDVPAGAKIYFKNLKDGETVKSPFKVEFGADALKVDTAKGLIVAGSGHHHLLIDAGDSIPLGTVVPKDSTHLHFGKAQTSTELTLPAGKHVLTLQFADGLHRSYGAKLAATIKVIVK